MTDNNHDFIITLSLISLFFSSSVTLQLITHAEKPSTPQKNGDCTKAEIRLLTATQAAFVQNFNN